ncbi:uncharacterized protein MKZ38_006987 [Zalerion maritima]|uniref:Uncharacterized protein n=1 Tax=Zalerion maritima TaxID=339359 RepID=A0AAD5RJE3_9PEZI|nr:uncharacterized protein MKZ38_006987 [Zalerion maritima]
MSDPERDVTGTQEEDYLISTTSHSSWPRSSTTSTIYATDSTTNPTNPTDSPMTPKALRVPTPDFQYPKNFWLGCAVLLLVEFGCSILGAPSPRLLEEAVCREYFRDSDELSHGDPTEAACKQPEVQVQLGFLITALSVASIIAATAMQIPMGVLADRKSRKLALQMNIASTILYWGSVAVIGSVPGFPLWSFFAAPIFVLLGGGPWVTGGIVFAAISDGISAEKRTTAFSIVEAVAGVADLVGPIVGAATMTRHTWIPFVIATACFLLMFVPTSMLQNNGDAAKTELLDQEPRSDDGSGETLCETSPLLRPRTAESSSSLSPSFKNTDGTGNGENEEGILSLVMSNRAAFGVSFLSFLLLYIARACSSYVIPWVSVRFGKPMAERDLALSTISVVFSASGTLLLAFAPKMALFATGFAVMVLGQGVIVTLRAYVAAAVDRKFSGRLFTAISMTETIGGVIGMPVMGASYGWSVTHGDKGVGLPFLVSAASYLSIGFILLCFQVKRSSRA